MLSPCVILPCFLIATPLDSVSVIQPSSGIGPPAKAEYPIKAENIIKTIIR